ncbi:MAG: hypothetical protein LBF41_10305 [Deltaproteobacteria bacterium]|nr:hypothetical protein [Deltaproteobacteria bacterium]
MDPLIFLHALYQGLGAVAAVPAVIAGAVKGRHGGNWADRFGCVVAGGNKPLWFHAASVGEAGSAGILIEAAKEAMPDENFVLSVGTPSGLAKAKKLFENDPRVGLMASPLDVLGAPGRTLDRMEPKCLVLTEGEVWPGLIRACRGRKIPVMLAAGRISAKSAARERIVAPFFRDLYEGMALVALISQEDKERIASLGVDPEKLKVLGSPKFDDLVKVARTDETPPGRFEAPLLIVAGSTHKGEEEIIISAFLKLLVSAAVKKSPPSPGGKDETPGDEGLPFKIILAPRHPERAPGILARARENGFEAEYVPDPDVPPETLPAMGVVNVLGKLNDFYKKCDIAIVGGSFVPGLQGHNPMEPAAYGRPVIIGPNMESFSEPARALMEVGGAKMCLPQDLHSVLQQILGNPQRPKASGIRGKKVVAERPLVAPLLAKAIKDVLFPRPAANDAPAEDAPASPAPGGSGDPEASEAANLSEEPAPSPPPEDAPKDAPEDAPAAPASENDPGAE